MTTEATWEGMMQAEDLPSAPDERYSVEELFADEKRNNNHKSDGKLLEALTGWIFTNVEPYYSTYPWVEYTPANNPGADLFPYTAEFIRHAIEAKDHFGALTLDLNSTRGIAVREEEKRFLVTTAWGLTKESQKTVDQRGVIVLTREWLNNICERVGGFPSKEVIYAWHRDELKHQGKATLRPDQVELANDGTRALALNDHLLLTMGVQLGKTITAAAILNQIGARLMTYGVPTLALKDKSIEELIIELDDPTVKYFVACSERGRDGISTHTPTVESLAEGLQSVGPDERATVVYVYDSSINVREAFETTGLVADASVLDEIHELIGLETRRTQAFEIPARKQIGLSATPLVVTEKAFRKAKRLEKKVYHINEWPTIELSPSKARRLGLSVPFEMGLVEYDDSDEEFKAWLAQAPNSWVKLADDLMVSAEDFNAACGYAQAIHDTRTMKTLFSFGSLVGGKLLLKLIPAACGWLGLPKIRGYYIDGWVRGGKRELELWEFENDPKPSFLVQCRTIDRGLAVKGLGGVALHDPRNTWDGLLQFVLRATGQNFKNGEKKERAMFFLKLMVPESSTWKDAVDESDFAENVATIAEYNEEDAESLAGNARIIKAGRVKLPPPPSEWEAPDEFISLPDKLKYLRTLIIRDLHGGDPVTADQAEAYRKFSENQLAVLKRAA